MTVHPRWTAATALRTSPTSLSQQIQLASTTPTTYTVSNLASGTWYFGATAYTTAGTESALSPVVTLTLQ